MDPTQQPRLLPLRLLEGLLFLLVLVTPLAFHAPLQEQTEPVKACLLGLGGSTLAALALAAGCGGGLRWPLALVLLLGLILWSLGTAPFALSAAAASEALLRDLGAAAFLLGAWLVLERPGARRAALVALVLGSLIAALLGLAQYEQATDPAVGGPFSRGLALLEARIPVLTGLASLEQTDAPGSFFGHTNVAAEFVLVGALLALAFAARRLLRGPGGPFGLMLAVLALGLVVLDGLFIVRSGSRGVLLGLALGAAMIWSHLVLAGARRQPLLGHWSRHLVLHGAVLALLLAGLYFGLGGLATSPRTGQESVGLVARLRTALDLENTTVRERLDLWGNTLEMIEDRPVFGVGPGNFRVAYPDYADRRRRHEQGRYGLRRQPSRPHNEYLAVIAEGGLPAGILFLAALAALLLPAIWRFSALRRAEAAGETLVLAALAGLAGILVCSCFSFPLQMSGTRLAFALLVAVLFREAPGWTIGSPGPGGRALLVVVLATLFVVLAAAHRARLKSSADLRLATSAVTAGITPLGIDRALDQGIARSPGRDDLLLLRAQMDGSLGRLAEAERGYQLALEAHPALANAWIGLAGVGFRRGSFEAVRVALRRATRLQARDPGIRIAAGRIHAGLGDRRAAIKDYEDALALATTGPDRLAAMIALAQLQADADRPTSAMHWLEQATTLAPDDPAVLEIRARFHERYFAGSERTHEAWAALRAVRPEHAEANLRCGQAEMKAGRYEDALASFETAFVVDPRLLVALVERGAAQAALGRLAEARGSLIEAMRRAVLPESRDPVLFERARDLIGRIEARAREEGLMKEDDR
ncbi:MAG: O-antigen ligase family protein [Planctomycetes bacterium]|nr:O-antigen ligase family protein [Planctomycetota bacterium]